MGATIAILTFAVFITIDFVLHYRKEKRSERSVKRADVFAPAVDPMAEPVWVGGYAFAEEPSYHPGHTWAKVTSPDTVVVGMDDFARRLVGKIKKVELPKLGSWLMQGSPGVDVETERGETALMSPVEGEVVRVNEQVLKDPTLATKDPLHRGWLYEIRSSHLASNLRNLLSGSSAKGWLEDSGKHLEHRLMGLSGSVLADGGRPADDFAEHLDAEDWKELTRSFLRN